MTPEVYFSIAAVLMVISTFLLGFFRDGTKGEDECLLFLVLALLCLMWLVTIIGFILIAIYMLGSYTKEKLSPVLEKLKEENENE